MNRYEFEDKISDYLENQLSVSERKAFEEYIKDNNEDRELVNSIMKTIDLINAQKSIKTSQKFMQNLINKVNSHKKIPTRQNNSHNKKLFFGLTPINSALMSAFIFAFVFLFVNILPTESTFFQSNIASKKKSMIEKNNPRNSVDSIDEVELVQSDSTENSAKPKEKIKLDNKIKLVKNK